MILEYGHSNTGDAEVEIQTSRGGNALTLMEMQKVNSSGFPPLHVYCIPAAAPAGTNHDYCH